ncbi:hypothetical protein ACEPPN_000388 [Leptodophora sp. 'Broadleaf-Isolate-01']
MFPIPCQRPRLLSGIKSEATNVEIAPRPPPPIPAITRPAITMPALVERPHINVPIPKNMLEKTSPLLRENISAEASHERAVKEEKEVDIGGTSVAMMVESRAAMKVPS